MLEGDRIAYGGHWWRLDEDGLILRYDEARREWDLWESSIEGPLPPPSFVEGERQDKDAGLLRRSFSRSALVGAGIVFLISGLTWIVTEAWMTILFTRNEGVFGGETSDLVGTLQVVSRVSYATSQVTLGAVVVVAALAVSRYVHLRNLLDS